MKFAFKIGLIIALLAGFSSPQPSAKAPAFDRNAFTFTNWDLDLRLETSTSSLFVRGKIALRNDSDKPQAQISLQISSSLKWASIQQNGSAIPFTTAQVRSDADHSGSVQEAIVTLPSPVPPGSSVELEVGYSGPINLDTSRLAQLDIPLAVRAATDYDRITPTFTCLRGVGHVLWFPVSIEPAIMGEGNLLFEEIGAWSVRHSSSSMTLRVTSDQLPPLHTNAQASTYEQAAGAAHEQDRWNHLGLAGPVLVAGNYQQVVARQNPGEAAFVVDAFPEDIDQGEDYARVIRETPPTITGKLNFPVALVELPEITDATYEADSLFLTPLKTIDRKSLELTLAYLFAHETLWSSRAWIYEGAAHLAQTLMRERQDGRAAAIAYMAQRLPPLMLADSGDADKAKSNSLINTTNEVFYRTKAMYVWWMLREIVGERALLDALAQYDPVADKEPSYIQRLLEKNSHKDLEWFFDDWVYQDRGLPEFTATNGFARQSLQGLYLVSATVENKGGAAAEVPVIVHTENGDVLTRLRVAAHSKTATRVEVNSRPLDVRVNDGTVPEIDRSDNTTPVRIANE